MFIISEISPQFHGNLAIAEQMILQSKFGGADAVKVQLYGETAFGIERAYLSLKFDELKQLKEYADKINIPLFATAFDSDRLGWCMDLDLPYLKIAARMHKESPDLIDAILSKNKPLFISVPSDYPLEKVVKVDNAVYFYCVSKYPTRLDEFSIPDFKDSIFKGISDHSIGFSGALYAAAHGAKFLEKHFTLNIAEQRSAEQAHLGAMSLNDLQQIKNISSQFEMISAQ
jgi:sialic acid synthase SpsE